MDADTRWRCHSNLSFVILGTPSCRISRWVTSCFLLSFAILFLASEIRPRITGESVPRQLGSRLLQFLCLCSFYGYLFSSSSSNFGGSIPCSCVFSDVIHWTLITHGNRTCVNVHILLLWNVWWQGYFDCFLAEVVFLGHLILGDEHDSISFSETEKLAYIDLISSIFLDLWRWSIFSLFDFFIYPSQFIGALASVCKCFRYYFYKST